MAYERRPVKALVEVFGLWPSGLKMPPWVVKFISENKN
jgi:hypothetical protein